MIQIKRTIIKEKDLTVFSVHGHFELDQLLNEIDRLYATYFTLHALWDFTNARFTTITGSHIEKIITLTRKYVDLRKGGKSAILVARDFSYGMARMYDTRAKLKNSPVKYRVFRDMNEALEWLEK